MTEPLVGKGVRRSEDHSLLTGRATFMGDLLSKQPGRDLGLVLNREPGEDGSRFHLAFGNAF